MGPAARRRHPLAQALTLGYFGAGTGAAAALMAAAALGAAPASPLVGGLDAVVLAFNQRAYARLPADKQLIISKAAHLCEEPGALQEVAWRAVQWFTHYLCSQPALTA